MTKSKRFAAIVLCAVVATGAAIYRAQTEQDMLAATKAFLVSLNPQQMAKVKYDLTHDERMNWFFTPVPRNGLPLKEMEQHQRHLAMAMLSAALSQKGFMKATTIMSLEQVLRDQEAAARAAAAANPPATGNRGGAAGGRGAAGGGRGGGGGGI